MVYQDPFTTELDLEPFRPFAYSHDAPVHFRDRPGTHWLVLDSIYIGQQGVTAHVVRPADLTPLDGVGGGMDNWAEYLGTAIREVSQVASLLGYGETKVRMLIISGGLRSLKDGRSRRVLPEWVEDYVRLRASQAKDTWD